LDQKRIAVALSHSFLSLDRLLFPIRSVSPVALIQLRVSLTPGSQVVSLVLSPVTALTLVMALLADGLHVVELFAFQVDDNHLARWL